jgi:hypothetical protein
MFAVKQWWPTPFDPRAPTPPPFSGDRSIQSSQEARTAGISRVAPRSDKASRFQFVERYFGV